MRLLHTSDWHLGRRLCEASLIEDQAHALEQVFTACREEKVDALVVAGDIYDRSIPPEEAVRLLSDFLCRMRKDCKIPCILISGNHDSAERLGFGAELFESESIYVRTGFESRTRPIPVGQGGESGYVWCLPYLEPEAARVLLGQEGIRGHEEAVRAALVECVASRAACRAQNAVLVGHLFAQGGEECPDSERPLVIGGAASVSPALFDEWAYVALGHLHRPQDVGGRSHVRYSGSLLKYSFGEAAHAKGLSLVEVQRGRATVRNLPLTVRRDVVRIEGSFDALLHDPAFAFAEGAYVEATYTDASFLVDTKARLQRRFPYLLTVHAQMFQAASASSTQESKAAQPARLDDGNALLESFWSQVGLSAALTREQRAAFNAFFEGALRQAEGAVAKMSPSQLQRKQSA